MYNKRTWQNSAFICKQISLAYFQNYMPLILLCKLLNQTKKFTLNLSFSRDSTSGLLMLKQTPHYHADDCYICIIPTLKYLGSFFLFFYS